MAKEKPIQGGITNLFHAARRLSIKRIVLRAVGIIVGLQALVLTILQIVSLQRKRYLKQGGFPHAGMDKVCVGENVLQLYDYGQDLYEAMLAAIDGARDSIYLETYIWKDDAIGQAFKEHLSRKAAEGVEVYVIFDWFGNLVVPARFKVFPPEIHAFQYRAMARPWHVLDPRRYALDHRKLLIVDGYTAFIGGYNLGSLYATTWRDTHLRIEGSAAGDITQTFIDLWNQHHPRHKRITRHYARHFNPQVNVRGTSALRLMFPIRDMYIEAIDRAERSIHLTNAYFVPDSIFIDALIAAARRGVDVQLLVPWVSNHVMADWLARSRFDECLKGGMRIFGYHNMLHAKTCTIDGQWSTIGTANLDRLSSIGNYEINVEVYNDALAHEMEELFEHDKTNAFELKAEWWLHRPWYVHLSERILAPLRFLM